MQYLRLDTTPINNTADGISAADELVITPKRQRGGLEPAGQPEVVTPAAFTTPTNTPAGMERNTLSGVGSVFVDSKRQSARANFSYSADGTSIADELVLEKAMRHAASRNLDGPEMSSAPSKHTPQPALKLPLETCSANLKTIGISMGSSSKTITVSYNALKRIEVDKDTVQARDGRTSNDVNPFELSDEEDPENDNGLLSHLIKDITDVDLDEPDLDIRICDLKVSGRKSKSSSKKAKARKKAQKLNKSVSP